MIYTVKTTSKFERDYKLMIKRGKDIKKLQDIVAKLQKGENLPQQ